MDDKLTIYIAVLTACLVLQTIVIVAAAIAMLKLRSRMEKMAGGLEEAKGILQTRVLPALDDAKAMQKDLKEFFEVARPKIETFLDNASRISTTARASAERVETTFNDAVDRVRLQVIRGDEMLTRTMDRIEETSEKVQHTVMSPVRQVSGIVHALSIGFGSYFTQQKRRRNGGPSDEMFI
jgi:methyl-accepting chemotaxis protein